LQGTDPLLPVLAGMRLCEKEIIIISACRSLPFDDMYKLITWVSPELTPARRLALIVRLPRLLEGGATDAYWGLFAADLAHAAIIAALKAADLSLIDDLPVFLSSVSDPRAGAWNQLVTHLFTGRSGTQASLTTTWIEKGVAATRAIAESADIPAAVDLIILAALTKRASADNLENVAWYLSPYLSGGTDEAILRILTGAYRVAKHGRHDILLAPCLLMIARLIADGSIVTRSAGALRNRDAQRISEKLLAWLSHDERVRLGKAATRLGPGPRRWWFSINEPPSALRRAARRSRLPIGLPRVK
jgi:hypothetical protein